MGDINHYFTFIEQLITESPIIVSHEITYEAKSRVIGLVHGRLIFVNSYLLEFLELVKTDDHDNKVWLKYRFHFMRDDTAGLFRYDNAPHHPEISSHPHHKHLFSSGKESVIASQPTQLVSVLQEIQTYL